MSNRDSLGFGDLIPQDVVDIFAHEKHNKRGRKQRSRSLGRALGWLKGKKKKDAGANGQNPGLGPALDLALDGHKGGLKSGRQTHPQGNSHAVPKIRDDDKTPAPPHLQENVFAEASRPKYLEDLHSEALEGLKLMQQEETSNGVEFQDNESTISTMEVQTDVESTGFMTDSTIADSSSVISAKSSISTRSSRSGLTRQGSTFRPLNSENKSEKKKTRRRHRKSMEGIPRHVQKELGLDRVGWTLTPKLDEELLHNGEILESPTSEGPSSEQDSGTTLSKDQAVQGGAVHASHRDDLALLHHMGPDLAGGPRPRSVAVPSMTTANSLQEPPSPVITTSPQAAYMSKIIPNAILPPSIEVVEISRGRSRSSLRTVSKSSLVQPSPAPSRASSRASSTRTVSSKESSSYPHTSNNPTDSSGWSNSDSSETLVSDSSTISSSSTPRPKSQDEVDKSSIKLSASKAMKYSTNGKVVSNGEHVNKDGNFVRSLSVMKPKRAPPPPSRSYSLHKAKRRSRDLADLRIVTGASPLQSISASGEENERSAPGSTTVDSPGYNGDTSSLDDSAGSLSPYEPKIFGDKFTTKDNLQDTVQVNAQTNAVSPSSGYSSQDGTSPHVAKQLPGSSPKHKKGIFAKLQRLFPGTSPAAPPSIKQTLDPINNQQLLVDPASLSPSVRALREIFNIPPHPKVHAPPPPPPEVWVHSRRSIELLLGPPVPDNLPAIIKKNPKDRRQLRNSSGLSEGSARGPAAKTKIVKGAAQVTSTKKVEESVLLNDAVEKQSSEKVTEKVDLNGNRSVTEEKVRASDMLNEMLAKAAEKREERVTALKEDETRSHTGSKAELVLPVSVVRRSPSPSPPPSHHPPQPPGKQAAKVKAVVVSPESSWPPPPPPMAEAVSGQDDLDFPLPPPPIISEESLVAPVAVPVGDTAKGPTASIPIVITECVHEAPQTSASQEAAITALHIPPPPSYSAPPPPVKLVSPAIPKKVLLPTVPEIVPQEAIVPEPKDISPHRAPPLQPLKVVCSTPKSPPPLHESSQETSKELPTVPITKVICPAPEPPKAQPPSCVKEQPPKESPPEEAPPLEVVKLPLPSPIVAPPPIDIPKESSPPPSLTIRTAVQEVVPTVVTVATPMPESPPPQVIEVSCVPLVGRTLLPSDDTSQTTGLQPPQSIPPPPPIEPSPPQQEQPVTQLTGLPPDDQEENTSPSTVETNLVPSSEPAVLDTVLLSSDTTSQNTDLKTEEVSVSPEPEAPTEPTVIIEEEPEPSASPVTGDETPELCVADSVPEDPAPVVSISLLDMVKLRSATEATKVQEEAQTQVTSESSSAAPSTHEAPQKPIRKSLILISPSSPPAVITTEPPVPKSQSLVIPSPPPSSAGLTPATKSPTAVTASPSMNLQEVIRMRTAARSKESPGTRISLIAPTSPMTLQRSPTNTASFIFSKSHLPMSPPAQKPAEVFSKTSEAESQKRVVKMPPPVAKKPKAKVPGAEATEGEHTTAGQADADKEKANGRISVTADGT
ncbi:uncharacterized protein ACB057_017335 [Neosynchiropus ocellatus]